MEEAGEPPGNDHSQLVVLPDDKSWNCTVKGPQPIVVFAVKPALGEVMITTVCVKVAIPQGPVAVSVTV